MSLKSFGAEVLRQLCQWPPTPSTIYGASALVGLVAFEVAGGTQNTAASIPAAIAALGVFAKIVPQAAPEIDHEVSAIKTAQQVVAQLPPSLTAPIPHEGIVR